MDLAPGYGAKNEIRSKKVRFNEMGMDHNADLVIRLPDWGLLRVISRSLFLFTAVVALLCFRSMMVMNGDSDEYVSSDESVVGSDMELGFESLPLVFRDLADEGLVKRGDQALILSSGIGDLNPHSQFLNAIGVGLVFESDLDRHNSIADETYDLIVALTIHGNDKFINRVLKIGGILVMQLSNDDPSNSFVQQLNYKFVYIRRFSSTIVAMRKIGAAYDDSLSFQTRPRLCGVTPESKKAALEGLEEVLFEPQRRGLALAKSSNERIKFLPNLLGDSLEGYRRRILITDENDDENNGVIEWFYANYPMKKQHFEVYNMKVDVYVTEMLEDGMLGKVELSFSGISDWLRRNAREGDYVVVKAESEVAEEMMREKTICLVDELFLECKNEWEDGGKGVVKKRKKKAYWECLALYGRLRDEGIAVHQWWG